MSIFHNILSNIQKNLNQEQGKNQEIAETISTIVGFKIDPKSIIVKKGVVYLNCSSTLKMAVMIKKNLILTALKEKNLPIGSIQ